MGSSQERKSIYNRGYSKGRYDRDTSAPPKFGENADPNNIFAMGYAKAYYKNITATRQTSEQPVNTFISNAMNAEIYSSTAPNDYDTFTAAESIVEQIPMQRAANATISSSDGASIIHYSNTTTKNDAEMYPIHVMDENGTYKYQINIESETSTSIDNQTPSTFVLYAEPTDSPATFAVESNNMAYLANTVQLQPGETKQEPSLECVNEEDMVFLKHIAAVMRSTDLLSMCMEELETEKELPDAILQCVDVMNELCVKHLPKAQCTVYDEEKVLKKLAVDLLNKSMPERNKIVILSNELWRMPQSSEADTSQQNLNAAHSSVLTPLDSENATIEFNDQADISSKDFICSADTGQHNINSAHSLVPSDPVNANVETGDRVDILKTAIKNTFVDEDLNRMDAPLNVHAVLMETDTDAFSDKFDSDMCQQASSIHTDEIETENKFDIENMTGPQLVASQVMVTTSCETDAANGNEQMVASEDMNITPPFLFNSPKSSPDPHTTPEVLELVENAKAAFPHIL